MGKASVIRFDEPPHNLIPFIQSLCFQVPAVAAEVMSHLLMMDSVH